jgi:zinc/manganese transport system substrate-binding protein
MFLPILLTLAALSGAPRADEKLKVLTTTPELCDIASIVGGERVDASSLLRGPEDPHFVDARPSSIKAANKADLFIKSGMSLEIGYEPLIVAQSRNPKIQPGSQGYLDASARIHKLEVPTGLVDRSMGDVHPEGNPHYLLDPMNGKVVAAEIRDALTALAPQWKSEFEARCAAFQKSIDEAMFGKKLLEKFSADALADLLMQGKLVETLKAKGADGDLGGWAATMAPLAGKPIVSFHLNTTYFTERFHLENIAALEPKPGVQPSAAHLEKVIKLMRSREVRGVFYAVFQPKKPVEKVCEETGATAVLFPHQVLSVPEAGDYLKMIDALVKVSSTALSKPTQ